MVPSSKLTWQLKITIGNICSKSPFSIAMLVYQTVIPNFQEGTLSRMRPFMYSISIPLDQTGPPLNR